MRVISRDAVSASLTPSLLIGTMRDAFLALHHREVTAPNEFHFQHPRTGDVHIKGAYVHDSEFIAVKLATAEFTTGGNHGCVLGINANSGAIEWLVDDQGLLTELRTAAAVALSVDLLARQDATSLAIIGSGVQAGFQWDAAQSVRPFVDVRVASRNPEHAKAFADCHAVRACANVEEAVSGAEVVLLTTNSRSPVLTDPALLAPGCHVTASGADTVGKAELSSSVIRRADLVVVDDLALAKRVGMLQSDPDVEAVTLGAIIAGVRPHRAASDRTICGLVGLGVQDAAAFNVLLSRHIAPSIAPDRR